MLTLEGGILIPSAIPCKRLPAGFRLDAELSVRGAAFLTVWRQVRPLIVPWDGSSSPVGPSGFAFESLAHLGHSMASRVD